jgi:hypothetical protein
MTATTKTPLGAETTNRKWYLDVDTTPTAGSSTWVPVLGITAFQPLADEANLADDSDFDSGGFGSQAKTATAWSATCTVARKVQQANATQYDPGQEYLRTNSIGKVGLASVVHVRYYEMEPGGPRVEAYSGWATVSWAEQGGDMKALDTVQVTLTGRGQLATISHPDTAAAVIAVVNSATPSALSAAGGQLVRITGTAFTGTTGATGVKFGTVNATAYDVISDSLIEAISPAHTAGTVAVVVTNAVGASTVNANVTFS